MGLSLSLLLDASFRLNASTPAIWHSGSEGVTYADLNRRVSLYTKALQSCRVSEGEVIAIFSAKNPDVIAVMLAALNAGIIYVPVDKGSSTRALSIFRNAKVRLVLTDDPAPEQLANNLGGRVIAFHTFTGILLDHSSRPRLRESGIRFMLFTSGSTGQPKGVLFDERNLLSFIHWTMDTFRLSSDDVIGSVAPFHFDLSVFDIFAGLLAGATIRLFNEQEIKNPRLISQELERQKITIIYGTPTFFNLLWRFGQLKGKDLSALRLILFAGEVFRIPDLRELRGFFPGVSMYNLYGPTETNVVTFKSIPEQISGDQTKPFAIGKACPYAKIGIQKGANILPFQPGDQGELLISGNSVCKGYLDDTALNKARFFHDSGMRWYRTGDMVSMDAEGDLHFLTRNDRMVKRHGYRIELAEIEYVLHQHNMIRQAVVIARNFNGQPVIKAVICLKQGVNPDALALRKFYLQQLPGYMLPDHIIFREEIPMTSSHKIDYKMLESEYFD